ncbi:hypothetical protein ACFQ0K_10565 [Nocardioides caeni]|uniref:Uncharacterized protein n=1 Tax=Nocardioides caeni TaxID=574700 RepID=A0A4S8N0Z9_9ACTN|nr:hypothetical protein [Nocardioides caeni]THV09345.1 hypothetical protein E9934_16535 [Nocardioides caeni]
MSNFPGPGQPGEQPATQVAPGAGPPPAPYGGGGYPPQPQQPSGGYPVAPPPAQGGYGGGYPGGGYPGGPGGPGGPGFPAPPAGGGGSKKGLVIGIIAAVAVLVLIAGISLFFILRDDDGDDDNRASDDSSETSSSDDPSEGGSSDASDEPSDDPSFETSDVTDPGSEVFGEPTTTAEEFTDAYIEGNCSLMESYSTTTWYQNEYGSGCETLPDAPDMSSAEYTFDDPTIIGTTAVLTGELYIADSGETYTCTWNLDGTSGYWLVNEFSYN